MNTHIQNTESLLSVDTTEIGFWIAYSITSIIRKMTVEHPQIDKCIVKQSSRFHESVSHTHTDIEGDRQSQRGRGGGGEREREAGRQAGR